MEFVKRKTWHELLVNTVFDLLRSESNDVFLVNNTSKRARDLWRRLVLKTGEAVYPDIVDEGNKLVYEIHVKGERRREYFDQLPDGWKGINVFLDEENNPQTLVVKVRKENNDENCLCMKRIKWSEYKNKDKCEQEKDR